MKGWFSLYTPRVLPWGPWMPLPSPLTLGFYLLLWETCISFPALSPMQRLDLRSLPGGMGESNTYNLLTIIYTLTRMPRYCLLGYAARFRKVGAISTFVQMLTTLKSYYTSPPALLCARYLVQEVPPGESEP